MPDRMKVTAQLITAGNVPAAALSDGWVHPKDLKGRINAQNLFGTPAENRRVELALTLSPAYPAFRAHADSSSTTRSAPRKASTKTCPKARPMCRARRRST